MGNLSQLLALLSRGESLEASARASGYSSSDEAARSLDRLSQALGGSGERALPAAAPEARPSAARTTGAGVKEAILHVDGASRGNPGPSAVAAILRLPSGEEIFSRAKRIGHATNNVAEYRAVLEGVKIARELGVRELTVRLDSELVMKQLTGKYRIKNKDLEALAREVSLVIAGFARCSFEHVPRGDNRDADRLANEALNRVVEP